ncbi:MAG: glycoside hydrolase family 30 beta sandwich domain-containing protein [Candidatus Limiplasma sp.]|nr:glycoside hydrolase family 30 beta sandwich domain-containing protein [Candidatus Limiplasma sp.]
MKAMAIRTHLPEGRYWEELALPMENAGHRHLICLYPEIQYQTVLGFGGAFTEASGATYENLAPDQKDALIQAYFSKEGLGYTLGRAHMGSCDFSLGNYACVQDPGDEDLSTFSLERDERYLLPMIERARQAVGESFQLLLSPWSPPPFMKTNGEMNHGGRLLEQYAGRWAQCIVEYVKRYRKAKVPVTMVTVQNEPEATQTWDSCLYTAQEEGAFIARHLGPALAAAGLGDVQIFIWDHNKERMLLRTMATLSNPDAAQYVRGVAFHWYTGDHFENVAMTARKYPELTMLFSEGCVEFSRFSQAGETDKAEMYAHDMLGNLNAGMQGFLDWNLLLNAQGGPNHVGNFCQAPIMTNGRGELVKQASYYYIGQFSRHIQPGAKRIGLSRYCAEIEATAFQNPDGSLVAVLLNRGEEAKPFFLQLPGGESWRGEVQGHEILTVVLG